jgi:2-hydroxychromene-2-carboxylate isomerase
VYAKRDNPVPAKQAYQLKDIGDWARHCGLRIKFPPTVFPVNSVKGMRGCVSLEPQGKLVKEQLKANTDELIRHGGFGSPTIFVNGDDMFFGNDRLVLVREAILRTRKA